MNVLFLFNFPSEAGRIAGGLWWTSGTLMAGDGVLCLACGIRRRDVVRVGVGAGAGVLRLAWPFLRGMVRVLSGC